MDCNLSCKHLEECRVSFMLLFLMVSRDPRHRVTIWMRTTLSWRCWGADQKRSHKGLLYWFIKLVWLAYYCFDCELLDPEWCCNFHGHSEANPFGSLCRFWVENWLSISFRLLLLSVSLQDVYANPFDAFCNVTLWPFLMMRTRRNFSGWRHQKI